MAKYRPDVVLTNAPVNLVLMGIHLQPGKWNDEIKEILKERLNSNFPRFEVLVEKHVQLHNGKDGLEIIEKEIDQLLFSNVDANKAILVNEGFVGFIDTDYIGFSKFCEFFKDLTPPIIDIMQTQMINGYGIRYIDTIVPKDGRPIQEYFENKLLPYRGDDESSSVEFTSGMSYSELKSKYGIIRLRVISATDGLALPKEFMKFSEKLELRHKVLEEEKALEIAIVDTDHYARLERSTEFKNEVIWGELDQMHVISGNVFFASVTDEAVKEWE